MGRLIQIMNSKINILFFRLHKKRVKKKRISEMSRVPQNCPKTKEELLTLKRSNSWAKIFIKGRLLNKRRIILWHCIGSISLYIWSILQKIMPFTSEKHLKYIFKEVWLLEFDPLCVIISSSKEICYLTRRNKIINFFL